MRTVYLAGPIGSISYEDATNWRDYAAQKLYTLGIGTRDPLRHKREHLKGESQIPLFDNAQTQTSEDYILTRDYYDCQQADVMLVKWDESQAMRGTSMELGWFYMMRKPIIMWGDMPKHPMVRVAKSVYVPTLREATKIVAEYVNV